MALNEFKPKDSLPIKRGIIMKADGTWIESTAELFKYLVDCGCWGFDCCMGVMKWTDVSGNGKDYVWNDDGTLVFGTKAEAQAAYEARS